MSAVKEKVGHTPGEWSAKKMETSVGHAWKLEPIGGCIYVDERGGACNPDMDPLEAEANAHLIAASPELLEYGEAVESACTDFMANPYDKDAEERLMLSLGDLRIAIAKAKGES